MPLTRANFGMGKLVKPPPFATHPPRGRVCVRTIAAADFFAGSMTTDLAEDELLTAARLPLLRDDTRFGFCEFSRRAGDYAIAMTLATLRLQNGVIVDPRVALGGAEAFARRIPQAEAALDGRTPEVAAVRA